MAAPKAAPIPLSPQQQQQRALPVDKQRRRAGEKAIGAREKLEELAEEGALAVWWREFLNEHRSWAGSAVVHMVLLILLALSFYAYPKSRVLLMATTAPEEIKPFDLVEDLQVDGPDVKPLANDVVDRPDVDSLQPMIDMQNAAEGIDAASQELLKDSLNHIPYNDLLCELGTGTGKENQTGTGKGKKGTGFGLDGTGRGMGGRGGRRGNATGMGATPESEAAVDLALKWLAEHQLPDGSWSFNHTHAASCQGKCPNPGTLEDARIGATAMGVLPFLGAGQTHQVGKYQKTVGPALIYLITHMKVTRDGGRLYEPGGRMYSHGLGALALAEASAMQVRLEPVHKIRPPAYDGSGEAKPKEEPPAANKEFPVPNLAQAAQAALAFIASAQDPVGGGWRYEPRTPGDTSVVGWQMMALISGRLGYLQVNPRVFEGCAHFLDTVQMDEYGSNYGYTDKTRGTNATRAIGLLCRMYMGWKRDHQGILQGVEALSQIGPQHGSMYYNYYATQVLHHFGGPQWEAWNKRMRDSLVAEQSKDGHTAGSWFYGGGDIGGSQGGRLYFTSLCALTLEVYYRHLPIYRNEGFFEGVGRKDDPNAEKKDEPKKEKPVDEF